MIRPLASISRVPVALLLVLLAVEVSPAAGDTTASIQSVAPPAATLAELVQDVGGRGATQSPQRYAYLEKLDSHLQDVAASRLGTGSEAGAAIAADRQGVTASAAGDIAVDVYVNGDVDGAADQLRALGMRVTATSERAPQRMVEGSIPSDALVAAAALGSTRAIVAAITEAGIGAITSQGDAAIRGPQARAFGPVGAGVSVGVISDSIDHVAPGVAGSQASGDLPASVVNLGDSATGKDEGRAMAEIIYDEAPGISGIVFATADGGPAAKVSTIDNLVAYGVKVIADDTSYVTEPFFQDGVVTQAVDRAKSAGVAYVIAAGNDGRQSWEGAYTGGASMDFDPAAPVDTLQTIGTFRNGDLIRFVLQWAEPWGRATDDFAVDVYVNSNTTPSLTINSNNLATGIPEEWQDIHVTSGAPTVKVAIRRVAGVGNPYMKFAAFTNGGGSVAMEHPVTSGAIAPDAASANGALTVAASHYSTPTTPEAFSSRGPVTRLLDVNGNPLPAPEVRQKPNISEPDGVATSVAGFSPFYGTSAATPAAAGIAALILGAKPAMSIDALYSIMTDPVNALDCGAPGNPDLDCGSGFLLADLALGMALDPTPPVVSVAISPATPDGANGWYRGPVSVTWAVSDAESPIVSPTGCAVATPGDGVAPLTCSATSAGGTTSLPVTIKRDSTPPSAPAFAGIRGKKTYSPKSLPKIRGVGCTASDPTSGVTACNVVGFSTKLGRHKLTATAVNGAGLTSSSTLTYTVQKPAAITKLVLAKGVTLARLSHSGIRLTVRVATGSTRLTAKLVARIAKPSGKGTREIVLGGAAKKVGAGTRHLNMTLTAGAKQQLLEVSKATLEVTVSGSSGRARKELLHSSVAVHRTP